MMRKVILIAAISQAAVASPVSAFGVDAAVNGHREPWRVVRTDYVEFCDANIASIDITNGALHGSIGNCDPHRNGPAKQVDTHGDDKDITALRNMLSSVKAWALADRSCVAAHNDAPPMPIVLSGPVTLSIERDGKRVVMDARSPCLTEAGRTLLRLVNKTAEPLRGLGLR